MKLKVGESLGMKLQYSDHNNDRKDARKFLGARDTIQNLKKVLLHTNKNLSKIPKINYADGAKYTISTDT